MVLCCIFYFKSQLFIADMQESIFFFYINLLSYKLALITYQFQKCGFVFWFCFVFDSWEFATQAIMSSADKTCYFFPSSQCNFLFLARIFSTKLNRSGECDNPCFPSFSRRASTFSSLSVILVSFWFPFLQMSYMQLRKFIASLLGDFDIIQNPFMTKTSIDIIRFFFQSLLM